MIESFAVWLENSAPAAALRDGPWLYPAVAVFHLVGAVVLAGSVVLLHLRVFVRSQRVALRDLAEYLMPLAWAGLALTLVTGALLFASQATALIDNPLLDLKLLLLVAAALNGALLLGTRRWRRAEPEPITRIAAGLSLVLWFAIVAVSRLLSYV